MAKWKMPVVSEAQGVPPKTAVLIASGDTRLAANQLCWPTQKEVEAEARAAFESIGWKTVRGSPERWSDEEPHGFAYRQCQGREIFESIHRDCPLVVVEAVWQYSAHVLMGLCRHRGPILILANWSGRWPGLVGALNLRASLTKAGVRHSLLWGEDFAAPEFRKKLTEWCDRGTIHHDMSHVAPLDPTRIGQDERALGTALAAELKHRPAIMGIFDEGCMGMYNAIIPDHLLHATGVYKERLSQSTLYAHMQKVDDAEAAKVRKWLADRGMWFDIGPREDQLTEAQILEQCKMYIACVRLADRFGCDLVGIQYQLGLADLTVASDLVEGMLNCSERPPVVALEGKNKGKEIAAGRPVTHFNEVDECAGLDALITERVWTAMGMKPDNSLHDVRWGDQDPTGTTKDYVWVMEISGAVPPSHFAKGYAEAKGFRQPAMYFAKGGSSVRGMSKPGDVVWSRIYVDGFATGGKLVMDIGRATAIALPEAEMNRRWENTTKQWPIMNAVLHGVDRDQFMAKHQSNHIQVVYADSAEMAQNALYAKAAMARAMGIEVNLCGI